MPTIIFPGSSCRLEMGLFGAKLPKLTAQDSKVPNDKATNKRYLEVKGLGKQVKSYPQ